MSKLLSRLLGKSPNEAVSDPTAAADGAAAPRLRVLMVCMGNICRSPTAEAVLRQRLDQAGLADVVWVDSAGTHAYHLDSPPDARSCEVGQQRGYVLADLRARKVVPRDYEAFDLLLAMDWDNLSLLEEGCPSDLRKRLRRLTEFIPTAIRWRVPRSCPTRTTVGPPDSSTCWTWWKRPAKAWWRTSRCAWPTSTGRSRAHPQAALEPCGVIE